MTCPNPECQDERVIYDVQDVSIPRMGIRAVFAGWQVGMPEDYGVIEPINFCPFCGTALPVRAEEEKET